MRREKRNESFESSQTISPISRSLWQRDGRRGATSPRLFSPSFRIKHKPSRKWFPLPLSFSISLSFSLFSSPLSSLFVFLSAIFPLLRLSTLVLISLPLLFPSLPRQCVVMHSKENHSKLLGGSGFKEANAVWHGEKFRAVHNPLNPLFLQRVKWRSGAKSKTI